MNLTKAERETIILFNEAENTADVFTYSKRLISKLEKLYHKYPNLIHHNIKDFMGAVRYTVPKICVTIRSPYDETRKHADSIRAKRNGTAPPKT